MNYCIRQKYHALTSWGDMEIRNLLTRRDSDGTFLSAWQVVAPMPWYSRVICARCGMVLVNKSILFLYSILQPKWWRGAVQPVQLCFSLVIQYRSTPDPDERTIIKSANVLFTYEFSTARLRYWMVLSIFQCVEQCKMRKAVEIRIIRTREYQTASLSHVCISETDLRDTLAE